MKTPRLDAFIANTGIFCDSDELCQFVDFAAALERELCRALAERETLLKMVHNQRCCRNCGNHWSANFDVCGLGEDTVIGRDCRENKLKNWRPMEYRYAKPAERGD